MKRLSLLFLVAFLSFSHLFAQENVSREQWLKDMREYKHGFLEKKIGLTKEQKEKFFQIYDKRDDELMRINEEARRLEQEFMERINNGEQISDTEYEQMTRTLVEIKNKEYKVDANCIEQLEKILSKKQIFDLQRAEREWVRGMMRKAGELKKDNDGKGGKRPGKHRGDNR